MSTRLQSVGRFAATVAAVAAGMVLAAVAIPQLTGVLGGGPPPEPTVSVQAGLAPKLDVSTVQAIAEQQLASMQTMAAGGQTIAIQKISAVGADRVTGVEAAVPVETDATGIRWVVRATGTFVGQRVPPGNPPIVADTGYLIIDDATGEVVGMGMP
jgi:hypothetical protein